MRSLVLVVVATLGSMSAVAAQSPAPTGQQSVPKAIYTPQPVYRPEWAKQGLTGKGVVLVTIDTKTGGVTGARMLQSTGNQLLDGAALQAYAQWRFEPGSIPQLKIPVEFAIRQKPQAASQTSKPAILYPLLILVGFALAVMIMRTRRRA